MRLESRLLRIGILRNYLERTKGVFFSLPLSPHMVNHTEEQPAPDPQETTSWAHMLCWALHWQIQELQRKITKVPKLKMKVRSSKLVFLLRHSQQLHKQPWKWTAPQVSEFTHARINLHCGCEVANNPIYLPPYQYPHSFQKHRHIPQK